MILLLGLCVHVRHIKGDLPLRSLWEVFPRKAQAAAAASVPCWFCVRSRNRSVDSEL